jgi:hypothetical protein
LEFGLLCCREQAAGRTEEDDGSIFFETIFPEPGGIGSRVDRKTVLAAQADNGGYTGRDAFVMEPGCFGKNLWAGPNGYGN